MIFSKKRADTTYCGPPFIKFFKIFRYILQQKDVVKCSLDYIKIYFAKMLDNLPYVLNPLILLKLMHKFTDGV